MKNKKAGKGKEAIFIHFGGVKKSLFSTFQLLKTVNFVISHIDKWLKM